MISYSPTLQAIVGSRGGVGGVHLLDIMDCNGNFYYWASRKIAAPAVIDATSAAGAAPSTTPTYLPWILSAGPFTFHRSLETDIGQAELQYVSGDTLQRDFDRIVRSSALYRAPFVYRYWSAAAEEAMRELHGTLKVGEPANGVVSLQLRQLSDFSSDVMPQYTLNEICPLRWAGKECGSTALTECQHSYPTCQVIEHIKVVSNNYEKNYGEAVSLVAGKVRNRARKI